MRIGKCARLFFLYYGMNKSLSLYISSIALITILLWGCSAHMVVRPRSEQSEFGPINETERPGIVKYLNAGAQSIRSARRDDAYRKMHHACDGRYKITKEGPRSEGGAIIPIGSGAVYAESQYLYISFKCVE